MFFSFNHVILGTILGIQTSPSATGEGLGVTQFRSIPYAVAPGRFRQSVLKTSLDDTSRNFTEYGYACPQIPTDLSTAGGNLPGMTGEWKYDENKCLTVVVTVPQKVLETQAADPKRKDKKHKGVPVIAYIHGGGLSQGLGAVSPFYDATSNIKLSLQQQQPVIYVHIGYRLNWFGFLASQDLMDEAKANKEPPSNWGLYDQRNALLWIQKFISGFGGDPDQVTVFGESAGACSVNVHMMSNIPVFKRAISQSGTGHTCTPQPLSTLQRTYDRLLVSLNINSTIPAERLKALRSAPVEHLIAAQAVSSPWSFTPLADASWFSRSAPTFNNVANLVATCPWVEEVIMGNMGFEGYMALPLAQTLRSPVLMAFLTRLVGSQRAQTVFQAYNLTIDMDASLFTTRCMQFLGDLLFDQYVDPSTNALSRYKPTYRYYFDFRNPFPGTLYSNVATHATDTLYMFQNLNFRFPTQQDIDLAIGFASRWIGFANGRAPWSKYEGPGQGRSRQIVAVANQLQGWTEMTRREDVQANHRDYWRFNVLNSALSESVGEDGYLDLEQAYLGS